ncbi:hypothetical protein [Anaerotaenia torta]
MVRKANRKQIRKEVEQGYCRILPHGKTICNNPVILQQSGYVSGCYGQ